MAYPKKADEDKYIKQNFSLAPQDMERLIAYCQKEERPMSWVVRKALDAYLKERGY